MISGIVIYTAIAIVGMLLVRAPWARWLALAVAVVTLVVGSVGGLSDVLSIAAVTLSLLAIGGLAGPWLRIWLRQRPGTGAGTAAVALPLVAVGALPLAGLASIDAAAPAAFALAVAGPVLAWAYARGFLWGLWGLRVVVPIIAIVAALTTGSWVGGVAFVAFGLACAVFAWSPGARDAQSPVQAPLPPPRAQNRSEAGR